MNSNKFKVNKCGTHNIQQSATLRLFVRHSRLDAHLWPAWIWSVIEVVIMNREKRVQVKDRKIPQTQCLEVIYLLHQA